jgi:CheY-like chemotaxis protein
MIVPCIYTLYYNQENCNGLIKFTMKIAMERIIQIVEDDQDIRFILAYVLADSGFVLETFESIKAFSNRERTNTVDLILLDVQLPDGNGIDLCRDLKSSELTKHIPVVVMSANASRSRASLKVKQMISLQSHLIWIN